MKNTPNWKAPVPDGIYKYFIKKLVQVKDSLFWIIKDMIKGETEIPERMFKGRTFLIYKKGDEKDPEKLPPNYLFASFDQNHYKQYSEAITKSLYE